MIILVSDNNWAAIERPDVQQALAKELRLPAGAKVPIVHIPGLPEEDDDGKPIFAFRLSAGELHYWRGEPITLPKDLK